MEKKNTLYTFCKYTYKCHTGDRASYQGRPAIITVLRFRFLHGELIGNLIIVREI